MKPVGTYVCADHNDPAIRQCRNIVAILTFPKSVSTMPVPPNVVSERAISVEADHTMSSGRDGHAAIGEARPGDKKLAICLEGKRAPAHLEIPNSVTTLPPTPKVESGEPSAFTRARVIFGPTPFIVQHIARYDDLAIPLDNDSRA